MWRRIRLIAKSGTVLLAVRFGLRVASLPRVMRWLHLDPSSNRQDLATLTDLAYYTDRWLAIFPANPKGNCLPRTVTLYRLARTHGFPVRFQCGIRRKAERLDGHAWLLVEDRAFLEATNQWEHFAVTFSFPEIYASAPVPVPPPGRSTPSVPA